MYTPHQPTSEPDPTKSNKPKPLRGIGEIAFDLTDQTISALRRLALLRELRESTEAEEVISIGFAKEQGHSYGEIGEALGVTKQAISKRFVVTERVTQVDDERSSGKGTKARQIKWIDNYDREGTYTGRSVPRYEGDDEDEASQPKTDLPTEAPDWLLGSDDWNDDTSTE